VNAHIHAYTLTLSTSEDGSTNLEIDDVIIDASLLTHMSPTMKSIVSIYY
jgi:hypothetical protein